MAQTQTKLDLTWRPESLLALIVLCTLAGGALGARLLSPSDRLADRAPVDMKKVQLARQKIDPNTASVASLRRLHGLGPAKTGKIIAYRSASSAPAFRGPADLDKVPGFGPATAERLAENMTFASPDAK